MAANYSSLIIDNEHSNPDYNILIGGKIQEIPHGIDGAGVYINHTILVGEILGLNVQEAISIMEIVHRVGKQLEDDFPDNVSKGTPIIRETGEILLKDFEDIYTALNNAIDEEGRPLEITGESLKNSPRIEIDEQGRMILKSHHIYLVELREMLHGMIKLLSYGIKNNMLLLLT